MAAIVAGSGGSGEQWMDITDLFSWTSTNNAYVYTNNALTRTTIPSNLYLSEYTNLEHKQRYRITAWGNSIVRPTIIKVALLDNNNNCLTAYTQTLIEGSAAYYEPLIITIPKNAAKMIIQNQTSDSGDVMIELAIK